MAETFRSNMLLTGRNTGIHVPDDVLERLGGGRRPAVAVAVNGYHYASTVGSMGGRSMIPFSSAHRDASGIAGGDEIEVVLELDAAPRDTPVPADLTAALADAGLTEAFGRLAPSRRKAHVVNVEGAKAEETRRRRVAAVLAALVP